MRFAKAKREVERDKKNEKKKRRSEEGVPSMSARSSSGVLRGRKVQQARVVHPRGR